MSDTDMNDNDENKEETRSEMIERLLAEKKSDEAKEQIKLFLAEEPENIDAHAWTAVMGHHDLESIHHFAFVFDRDIRYDGPYGAIEMRDRNARKQFLFALMMQMHGRYMEDEQKAGECRKMAEMLVKYSEKFLAACVSIKSINDFAEALATVGRYDDVIKLGQYVTGNVKAEELGWPGLVSSRNYSRDETGEIVTLVIDSYYLTERHAEGCKWIHDVILKKKSKEKYDYYLWYLLGWTLGWLGYPEETARAWIISVSKGNAVFDTDQHFSDLHRMILDRNYKKKDLLHTRFFNAKKLIAPEKENVYKEIQSQVYHALNAIDEEMPTVDFIENKLGITLPPVIQQYSKYENYHETIGYKRSNDSVVKEVIATLDREAGAAAANSNDTLISGKGKREKVRVGGPSLAGGSTLEQFGIDLTSQAAKGEIPPIVGREREVDRMIRILSRAEKNNPVLLGEAGVGKTAIVQGLAQRIARGDVPDNLKDKIIVELNVGVLVAGTGFRGDFEMRMTNIMKETRENASIILFIDELHTLMGSGDKKHGLDGSNILKPALASGDLRLIGATTPGEYSRSIEKDPAMDRRFSPVWLSEIDKEMTRAVLDARRLLWEKHHNVAIEEDVFNTAIQLTDQHIRHRHFPDKAIDAVDEACALVRTLSTNDSNGVTSVKREHIVKVIDEWLGAETEQASKQGMTLLKEIRSQFESRISGHETVIEKVSYLAADIKFGLRLSRLPRVACFAGAAQSGKTETARALAQVLWPDSREKFLYINMKLLNGEGDLNRLTGAARGYAGSDVGGLLTHHLRQHPHSIVYLYHFDKAHPKIKNFFGNLFLQGSFPDADGRSIHVGSTLFILSVMLDSKSTAFGFGQVKNNGGTGASDVDDIVTMLKLKDIPESVITSLSETFRFQELTSEQIRQVIKRKFNEIINQPGIREFQKELTDDIIDSVVSRYQLLHADARNIQLLLNRELYGEIGRVISR
ncbi:MAG TPA: AAA family ATPase [Chitinispirillaceae bacterium]|nr:AAA family ATPase [Chitinispirillaceae bacterium]